VGGPWGHTGGIEHLFDYGELRKRWEDKHWIFGLSCIPNKKETPKGKASRLKKSVPACTKKKDAAFLFYSAKGKSKEKKKQPQRGSWPTKVRQQLSRFVTPKSGNEGDNNGVAPRVRCRSGGGGHLLGLSKL